MGKLVERYNFAQIAEKCREKWKHSGVYDFSKDGDDIFSIDTPPPTISGSLHIGHVFSYCHTDFIARYQRMRGKNVFYSAGFDNNGLPTERLVEKTHKIRIRATEQHEFIRLCDAISEQKILEFKSLFDSIALSLDWSFSYQTNSEACRRLSQKSFLNLYKKGLIYRKKMPVLWDVIDQTAIAQAEVEEKEFESQMNYIIFSSEDGRKLEVATTRPELLPGCVALLCNPSDERYRCLNGKYAFTPLFDVKIPIICDESVLVEKGTGLVMCCTFGDEMDIKWWQQYDLPLREVVDRYGKIDALGQRKVEDARKYILECLDSKGLLKRQEKITHNVKCAERSGGKLEIISTYQWYIRVLDYKEELKVKVKEIDWIPEKMRIKIEQWIDGIKWDWCISRQRYLGVRVPVYYDEETEEILLPEEVDLPINGDPILRNGRRYRQDTDVLDTWATSSLTPQINHDSIAVAPFRRMSLRPQAHEIIRTWAFYTILRSFLEYQKTPWERIMISGWCLASDKSKMSKSKGNTIDPVQLISDHGADIVRYWSASAGLGCDTCFSDNVFLVGKKLMNKIWNASRFIEQFFIPEIDINSITYPTDIWIISRLAEVIEVMENAFDQCDYSHAKSTLERFFMHEYCDNYLELVKSRAYNSVDGNISAIHALSISLSVLLKLFAPFFPYITEEIYSTLFPADISVHSRGMWPEEINIKPKLICPGSEFIHILSKVREFKSEHSISMKKEISLLEITTSFKDLVAAEYDLKMATNSLNVTWRILESAHETSVAMSL
ncbi:valine--tRNA ligase [Neorickettsia helminthoeca str. Oregon]|uniref:Valine--tRNA ligase n=1 Tax=Neorickettsia helminthoeca str. Oregon TaxID=1286528 RepID=X5GWX6_9RICK|nr:valine--tRNA ligase [Neorickettsia helminthoeca]AHX11517.1 valine--tRNA ligase [Neorickettsia helminthoeca str. Oregon]